MQIGVDCALAVGTQRIFVLDTDEIGRMAVQFMLHDEYETHDLGSLQAAREKAQDWPPTLLILGEAVLQEEGVTLDEIRQQFPSARLLVITEPASAFADDAVAIAGMVLLCKPLRLEDVRAKVASALQE